MVFGLTFEAAWAAPALRTCGQRSGYGEKGKRKSVTPSAEEETGDGTAGPELLDSPVEAAARAPSSLSPAAYRVVDQYVYHRKRERTRDEVEPRELPKSSTNALLRVRNLADVSNLPRRRSRPCS